MPGNNQKSKGRRKREESRHKGRARFSNHGDLTTSQPYPGNAVTRMSVFREGPPLEPPALASTHSFRVCTLLRSRRVQITFPFHHFICCSRPDNKGRKAAWPSPQLEMEAGQFGPWQRTQDKGSRLRRPGLLSRLSMDFTFHP